MTLATDVFNYSAFVSYSHHDRRWGEWLQSALEDYAVPQDVPGATYQPRSFNPVFRDRWAAAAGPSLPAVIEPALDTSCFLIVICSPNSAENDNVDGEIWRFKNDGRGREILALIVDGEPGDPKRECFPRALRFDRATDGSLAPVQSMPLAADARPKGDGKDLAKLKIIAGMMGVPLHEIWKREQIEQRRRVRQARMIAASMAALALVAFWSTYVAVQQMGEAQRRYEQALDSTIRFVTTSATFRTLLTDEKNFWESEREGKLASGDWQAFMRESRNPEGLLLRLVRVLARYETTLAPGMDRFRTKLDEARMPLQWLKHAERVAHNLIKTYGKKPEYVAELESVEGKIVALGGKLAKECLEIAAIPQPGAASLDQLAQGAIEAPLDSPCP